MRWWCPAMTEVIRRDLSVARERVTPAEAASGAARRVELAFAGAVGYSPVPKREAGLRRKAMLEQIDRGASKPEAVRTALAVNPLARVTRR